MTETVQSAPRHPLFHPLFAKVEYHYNILFPEMQALFEKKTPKNAFVTIRLQNNFSEYKKCLTNAKDYDIVMTENYRIIPL